MSGSVLLFCGQPVATTPIGQRIGAFAAYLRRRGWNVCLSAVDPHFTEDPFSVLDTARNQPVEILGPTHYRVGADGQRQQLSPTQYLTECWRMTERIRQKARGMSADFVILSTTLPAALYAVAAIKSKPYQVWMDVDDWSAGQFAARGGAKAVGTVYGLLERTLPRRAKQITVCSRELHDLFPRAHLVPNFIRLDEVPARPAVPASQKPVRVAFASGVTAYHGHIPFLEALASRKQECAGLEFWIMGDGDALPECRRLVENGGLAPFVHFTGSLPRRDMLDALVESPVAILPLWDNRLNRARFPLKMLDYLACGCAIAASNTGMAREALRHGETALLSEPGNMNALIHDVLVLARDPNLRERLRARGATLVRDYDENVVCEKWMQLLTT
jgi:glycosyltransferase involved in cell wall biosynthesis